MIIALGVGVGGGGGYFIASWKSVTRSGRSVGRSLRYIGPQSFGLLAVRANLLPKASQMKIKQELLEMLSVGVKLFKRSARFIQLVLGYIQQVFEQLSWTEARRFDSIEFHRKLHAALTWFYSRQRQDTFLRNVQTGFGAYPGSTVTGLEWPRGFPDFMKTAQDGGKVVSLTHGPPLPPENKSDIHFS